MSFSFAVNQLLRELDKAASCPPAHMDETDGNELAFEVHIFELEFGDERPLSERLGISKSLFVPEPELDDDEVEAVVKRIIEVWELYHYYADLPASVPPRLAYTALLGVWDELVPCVMTGRYHFTLSNPELEPYFEKEFDQELPF